MVPMPNGFTNLADAVEAAERGDVSAMRAAGRLLEAEGDLDRAESWYRRAVDGASLAAMNSLGLLLKNKRDDSDGAEPWFRRAAAALCVGE